MTQKDIDRAERLAHWSRAYAVYIINPPNTIGGDVRANAASFADKALEAFDQRFYSTTNHNTVHCAGMDRMS